MATTIEDGSGKGFSVKVDAENRLFSRSITETEFDHAVRKGESFNVNTEFLVITANTETPIMYLKNNENEDVILAAWFIGTDNNAGSPTRNGLMRVYFNPTSGTIISSGVDVTPVNRKGGSSGTIELDVKAGGEGFTAVGYDPVSVLFQTQGANSRAFGNVQLALSKGSSVVVTYLPNGGTNEIYTGFQLYKSEIE
tara:strand:- start:67 stop:654 length:588 start_codon:yes stop_codon:yes gene_type:complete